MTISFIAPVVFTRTSARDCSLLQGHPDKIAAALRQYQALGVRNFNINLPPVGDICAQQAVMEQFVSEVVPLVPQE